MSLYDDALNEYSQRNSNLTITWDSITYNPYDFLSNSLFSSLYDSAIVENGAGPRIIFLSSAERFQVFTLTNNQVVALRRLAMNTVQQLRDGYGYILDLIDNGTITESSEISPAWNAYDEIYVNPRVVQPTNEQLKNMIDAIPVVSRSQSSVSRSLNSAFQVSATKDCLVFYSIEITVTNEEEGVLFLEIASDEEFTINVQELGQVGSGILLDSGSTASKNSTVCINGYVPASYYASLRTQNINGTPTFTYKLGQEVLL
jgi:hypothetical protein